MPSSTSKPTRYGVSAGAGRAARSPSTRRRTAWRRPGAGAPASRAEARPAARVGASTACAAWRWPVGSGAARARRRGTSADQQGDGQAERVPADVADPIQPTAARPSANTDKRSRCLNIENRVKKCEAPPSERVDRVEKRRSSSASITFCMSRRNPSSQVEKRSRRHAGVQSACHSSSGTRGEQDVLARGEDHFHHRIHFGQSCLVGRGLGECVMQRAAQVRPTLACMARWRVR